MEDWYVQTAQPTFNSGLENEEFDNYIADGLDEILTETPLGSDIILCKGRYDTETGTFETELESKGVIQGTSPETQTKGWERQLLTKIDTIGDYKYVKANGSLWLIMTKPSNNKYYEKVVLFMVNYIAKWQNSNLEIINLPMFVSNASQYNSGEEKNKTLSIGYNQLLVYASLDNDTKQLNREKRLFIDYNTENPLPYKITRVDTVSYSYGESRLINFIFTEDQYNPKTDRIDLMLCDYKEQPEPANTGLDITYNGQPQVVCGGNGKTFTAVCEYPIVLWEKNCTTDINEYVTIIPDAIHYGKCKVKCANNSLCIGGSFKIKCTDDRGNTGELLVNIVGGV